MFGNKNLIMNNKILAKKVDLEDRDIDKEYEIELDYRATVTSSLRGKTIIKAIAKTEEKALDLVQDTLFERIRDDVDSSDIEDVEVELDDVETTVLNIVPCIKVEDTKTIDMFNR